MASFFLAKENNDFKIIIDENLINILIDDLSPYSKFFDVTFKLTDQLVIGSIFKDGEIKPFLKNDHFSLKVQIIHEKNKLNKSIQLKEWLTANKILRNYSLSIDDVNKYRPLELNYDLLRVSFDKGCYRGQEVVARMRYLGVDRRRFSTVITKTNYKIEKEFKLVGEKIVLKDYVIFNAIIKREDLDLLNEESGVIAII
jgi:folate-binding protein YgfZ